MKMLEGDIADLESFFCVHKIEINGFFEWQNIEFHLVKLVHIDTGYSILPSYGLFFAVDGVKVFITTDTKLCLDILSNLYQKADIIFQDCETSADSSPVHAHYQQLRELPEVIKNKMWLYGYQPGELPHARKDGFSGFVKRGQIFDFSNLSFV